MVCIGKRSAGRRGWPVRRRSRRHTGATLGGRVLHRAGRRRRSHTAACSAPPTASAGSPPCTPSARGTVAATLFAALGVDPAGAVTDAADHTFPVTIGDPIAGLWDGGHGAIRQRNNAGEGAISLASVS